MLSCDVMLLIMETVLKRSLDLRARHWTESHLHKVVHLIGYALQEEETGDYEFYGFVEAAGRRGLLAMLEELQQSARVEMHRDLLVWTVRLWARVEKRVAERRAAERAADAAVEGAEQMVTAPTAEEEAATATATEVRINDLFLWLYEILESFNNF